MKNLLLTVELIPKTSFYNNVRALLSQAQWDKVRKKVYSDAGYVCEICGDTGPKHPVEAHEVWLYDDQKHIQKLEKMIALCPNCHQVKHIGLAQINGKFEETLFHLMKVNKISKKKASIYIEEQFKLWNKRSQFQWALDISILKNYNIDLKELNVKNNKSK